MAHKISILIGLFLMSAEMWALGIPQWVKHLPSANNNTYYYRTTKAEGMAYEEAYAKAFSMAILESQWKLGVKVNKSNDSKSIEQTISSDVNVRTSGMNLPINKVCEYEQTSPTGGVILYILWQVASDAQTDPQFENFLNCE